MCAYLPSNSTVSLRGARHESSPDSESEGAIVEELSSEGAIVEELSGVGKQVDVEELFNPRFVLSEGIQWLLESRVFELTGKSHSRTFP